MKIITLLIIMLSFILPVQASDFIYKCPYFEEDNLIKENIINKITGTHFLSEKMTEKVIQKELSKELNSKINVNLKILNLKRLKNGEFKSLKLKSNKINYNSIYMSEFCAYTVCSLNKIVYENNKIYFPENMYFKYSSVITNEDLQNMLKSEHFQKEINTLPVKIINPSVIINNNKLYIEIPIKTFVGIVKIKHKAAIEINNNKIIVKNINTNSKNKIIDENTINSLTNKILSFLLDTDKFNTKDYEINITKAKISDNIINIDGIFVIKKNHGGKR